MVETTMDLEGWESQVSRSHRRGLPHQAARRLAFPYLVLDALEVKRREGGRTVKACVVHAVAVNAQGFRESLGLAVVTSENGAAWLAFLRSLVAHRASSRR